MELKAEILLPGEAVTGECLAEAMTRFMPCAVSRPVLLSAFAASAMTSMAEILGGAIALRMLFGLPVKVGAALVTVFFLIMLITNSY